MPNENGTWIMYGVSWDDPEHLWGYDYVTSAYTEDPEESAMRITKYIMDTYPIATDKQIKNIIGVKPGNGRIQKMSDKNTSSQKYYFFLR